MTHHAEIFLNMPFVESGAGGSGFIEVTEYYQ